MAIEQADCLGKTEMSTGKITSFCILAIEVYIWGHLQAREPAQVHHGGQ